MSLDKEAILKLSRLSRIAVDDQQAERTAGELSSVLGWIEQLQEVDIDDVTPMTSVLEQEATVREDGVNDGHNPDRVLQNAPVDMKGYFSVPKVIE